MEVKLSTFFFSPLSGKLTRARFMGLGLLALWRVGQPAQNEAMVPLSP